MSKISFIFTLAVAAFFNPYLFIYSLNEMNKYKIKNLVFFNYKKFELVFDDYRVVGNSFRGLDEI